MMRPMMRKVAFGVPAVALSAALACTMAGCGGTEGGQGGSGDNAPAGQTVNGVQTAEVAGFTIESVGDGSYYRGAAERQDGFWLRVKITNSNEAAKAPSAFSARAAVGTFDAGDAVFDASGDQRLTADTKTQAVELGEGAQMDANTKIEPGQSVEFIYFWTTEDNYYGPITVQFDKNATGGTDPRTMRFDTTGKESDGYKAAVEAAEAIKAQSGVDYAAYSVKAADGWSLVETPRSTPRAPRSASAPARARALRRRKPRPCRATSAARARSTRWTSTAPPGRATPKPARTTCSPWPRAAPRSACSSTAASPGKMPFP